MACFRLLFVLRLYISAQPKHHLLGRRVEGFCSDVPSKCEVPELAHDGSRLRWQAWLGEPSLVDQSPRQATDTRRDVGGAKECAYNDISIAEERTEDRQDRRKGTDNVRHPLSPLNPSYSHLSSSACAAVSPVDPCLLLRRGTSASSLPVSVSGGKTSIIVQDDHAT